MKNIVCINATNLTRFAHLPIAGKKSAFQRACEAAVKLPDVEKVVVFGAKGTSVSAVHSKLVVDLRPEWDLNTLLQALKTHSEGMDSIFYFYGDCPFLDPVLSEKMHANHVHYFADYSFADGFPHGLAPEIISPRIVSQLATLALKAPSEIKRDSIFDIIKKDINSFDVETELSPTDMRFLRAHLYADKKRNYTLIERLASLGNTDSGSILAALEKNPEILRTFPSFYSIQIVERCPYPCSYCPYPKLKENVTNTAGEMQFERFTQILDKIEGFSGDAYIDISIWGDPVYHSRIGDIIRACCIRAGIELVIETSGIGYKPETLDTISRSNYKNLTWIVSLDASKREVYERLRGKGFDEVRGTVDRLMELFPGKVYVQAVRMKENEEDVELFYNYWKTKTENIIIQKYDHFAGYLPERKVTDLSPLTRLPCWHVKRDMAILMDGTVALCKEDLRASVILGNVFTDNLEVIWEKGNAVYLDHIKQNYTDLCKNCDEYYTFNF